MAKHGATVESDLVLAGRVGQVVVKPGEEVISLPSHTASNPYTGKVFNVEVHHQRVDQACPGYNVGLDIKGLDKNNMPRSGDVMVRTVLGTTEDAATAVAISAELAITDSEFAKVLLKLAMELESQRAPLNAMKAYPPPRRHDR